MRVHLIAIGGSAMHNIALALHNKGYKVTGSDDIIYEPSKTRLKKYGLLPEETGWFTDKITKDIDDIILGMHAKEDNPEILKAKKLKIPIFSYPEYIYKESTSKKRVVISGSHGKTSITAMILHVLKNLNIDYDYMVGAQLEGFNTMVKLTEKSKIIIIEGDEYLSSCLDKRPKFHLYKPHIAVLSGIAWDHINVFPTFLIYIEQFRIFKNMIKDTLIYCSKDRQVSNLIKEPAQCKLIPYSTPKHKIQNGITSIKNFNLKVFGEHNLQNINAARLVCQELGVEEDVFYKHISSFKGAKNRLELIKKLDTSSIYKDFAHSPSKLEATTKAVKKQFKNRKLVACLELHTFSSLNKKFLKEYYKKMNHAEKAIIFFDKRILKNKGLKDINEEIIKKAFNHKDIKVFTNSKELKNHLKKIDWNNTNLLMMSSGNFNNINLNNLI